MAKSLFIENKFVTEYYGADISVSLEGQYVTLTFDLSNKKISSCGTIKAVTFMLGYMRGEKAAIDHINIGRKNHSLNFGFGKDGSVPRYAEGAYGGHDFDDAVNPTRATNCTKDVGGYFKLDPVEGTMTLYTGEQYYGTLGAGEHYGDYLATSASSGSYAFVNSDANLPLSYDPSQAEILEVRFKTEAPAPQEGHLNLCLWLCRSVHREIGKIAIM